MDLLTITPSELVDTAERRARNFKDDRLKTNQIRNFYAAVTAMRTDFQRLHGSSNVTADLEKIEWDLILLKPKLAYAAGRQRAVRANFYPFMTEAIDAVAAVPTARTEDKKKAFKNFFDLIESVVGYHKFFGDS